jgi:cytochrome c553
MMSSKLILTILFVFTIGTFSFAQSKKASIGIENEAQQLVTNNCYSCHSPSSSSHDEIIAPPMIAVKTRYLKEYNSEKDFVDAIVSYAKNPSKLKTLMKGAVNKFGVMPQQNFSKKDLQKIAKYIYNNPIKEPEWFKGHFEIEHKKN